MNKFCTCVLSAKKTLVRVHLVDKCLILFMIVLLIQSAFTLFTPGGTPSNMGDVDVIVRTSAAAIFGYFLSANFIRHAGGGEPTTDVVTQESAQTVDAPAIQNGTVQNRIGFASSDSGTSLEPSGIKLTAQEREERENASANRLQVIVATAIGLFCLLTLLLLRDVEELGLKVVDPGSAAATITQFRDFISGCVGFLIGCPTRKR